MDEYSGNRGIGFLSIPITLLRDDNFTRWTGTAEWRLWSNLYSWIIRGPMRIELGQYLFKNYFQKGKLVARWSQEELARKLGLKSKGHISNLLNSMVNKGMLKKEPFMWYGKKTYAYVFGTHDGEPHRNETLYAFVYFTEKRGKTTLENFTDNVHRFGKTELT